MPGSTYLFRRPRTVVKSRSDCMVPSLGALISIPCPHLRCNTGPVRAMLFDSIVQSLILRCRPSQLVGAATHFTLPTLSTFLVCSARNLGSDGMPVKRPRITSSCTVQIICTGQAQCLMDTPLATTRFKSAPSSALHL